MAEAVAGTKTNAENKIEVAVIRQRG